MARDSNLLVLDEPTNDLDVETLDLMQEVLDDYDGTVLLVSHDRDFLDRVATTTVAMEGDGRATVYAGGWSDYRAQRSEAEAVRGGPARAEVRPASRPAETPAAARPASTKPAAGGLSFTERHRLEKLPAEIARLEAEIAKLSELLADPALYASQPAKFHKATEALAERQAALEAAEEDWLRLEEKAAGG
jgi:ATP-binding cassette subfamily F protein uup